MGTTLNKTKPITFCLNSSFENSKASADALARVSSYYNQLKETLDWHDVQELLLDNINIQNVFNLSLNKLANYLRYVEYFFFNQLVKNTGKKTFAFTFVDNPMESDKQTLIHLFLSEEYSKLIIIKRDDSKFRVKGIIIPSTVNFDAINVAVDLISLQRVIDPQGSSEHRFNIHTNWSLVTELATQAFNTQHKLSHLEQTWRQFYSYYTTDYRRYINRFRDVIKYPLVSFHVCTAIASSILISEEYMIEGKVFNNSLYTSLPNFVKKRIRDDLQWCIGYLTK